MIESTDRVEQFKADIADMRLKDPSIAREQQLLWLGVVMMVVGVILAIASYFGSHSSTPPAQQDYVVVALIGVTVSVVGAALFLRYSIAQFLRFWMARLIYEQQTQTDRIVGAPAKTDHLATKN
jgi:hypothetical protein